MSNDWWESAELDATSGDPHQAVAPPPLPASPKKQSPSTPGSPTPPTISIPIINTFAAHASASTTQSGINSRNQNLTHPISESRSWPTASDYMAAMQNHSTVLTDRDLAHGRVKEGIFGLPAVATGQTAAVFRVDSDEIWAVRCLTMQGSSLSARYQALGECNALNQLPFLVHASWQENGIWLSGEVWPIVKMKWVVGQSLASWTESRLSAPNELEAMSEQIESVATRLWAAGIVHGDLQHGNIIVSDSGEIVLIDYDGVFLFEVGDPRTLTIDQPGEAGHPNYQHPHRIEAQIANAWTDTFSALVLSSSLLALAEDPTLWGRFHNGENLILTSRDFEMPRGTETWRSLEAIPSLENRLQMLDRLCRRDSLLEGTLDDLLAGNLDISGAPWQASSQLANAAPANINSLWNSHDAEHGRIPFLNKPYPPQSLIKKDSIDTFVFVILGILIAIIALVLLAQ